MENPIRKIGKYSGDVVEELKKCTWPKGDKLWQSTVLVIIVCVLLALFVLASDTVLSAAINKLS